MADKKISPRDAALAILKKAEELYKASPLAKAETLQKGDWKKIHDKLEREGYSKESADKIDGSIKAKLNKAEPLKKDVPAPTPPATPMAQAQASMRSAFGSGPAVGKSDEMGKNPDAQADARLGEKVEQDVAQHESQNADPAHEAPMKGHIKLAKFVGAMEQKRGKHKLKMDTSQNG